MTFPPMVKATQSSSTLNYPSLQAVIELLTKAMVFLSTLISKAWLALNCVLDITHKFIILLSVECVHFPPYSYVRVDLIIQWKFQILIRICQEVALSGTNNPKTCLNVTKANINQTIVTLTVKLVPLFVGYRSAGHYNCGNCKCQTRISFLKNCKYNFGRVKLLLIRVE